jgi:pimeloyl-ACP methyl ester carboxylesterase
MADIVFIPGLWHSPETVLPLREHCENKGHAFHVPPVRGHRSLRRRVRSVEAFILNERFDAPPVVIGHGMGGLIAQLVAAGVETGPLVLMNSPAPARGISGTIVMQGLRWLLFSTPSRIATPIPGWKQSCLELGLDGLINPNSLHVGAGSIAAPILVLSGTQDNLVPLRDAMNLCHHYPQAEFHGFSDHGHWILEEAGRERVFHAMTDWVEALEFYRETTHAGESSIVEEKQSHHEHPSLYPAKKNVSAAKRSRLLTLPDYTGRFRGGFGQNATSNRRAVLPR